MGTIPALMPFARRAQRRRRAHDRCELCGEAVAERHAHVVELATRALRCACTACAILFRDAHAGGGRFRTVPDRVVALAVATLSAADWARLELPVQLAFVVRDDGWTAYYPSPAGSVAAPLSERAAQALVELIPRATDITPHVEAILLHRPRGGGARAFVVPVAAGYELVGIARATWRGFDGGDDARAAIDNFIARLDAAAQRGKP